MKNQRFKSYKTTLENLLDLKEEDHNIMIHNVGVKWLENYFKYCPQSMKDFESSNVFWSWWINQWNQRCYEIVNHFGFKENENRILSDRQKEVMKTYFYNHHKTSGKIYPPKPLILKIHSSKKGALV